MSDPNRLAGVMYVTVDGRPYQVSGEGTYQVSGSKREPLVGQDGWHGYSETPQPGMMKWKGRDGNQVLIGALNEASNVTGVEQLANGKTIIGRNMVRMGDPIAVNTEDGTFDLEFTGPDVTEN